MISLRVNAVRHTIRYTFSVSIVLCRLGLSGASARLLIADLLASFRFLGCLESLRTVRLCFQIYFDFYRNMGGFY